MDSTTPFHHPSSPSSPAAAAHSHHHEQHPHPTSPTDTNPAHYAFHPHPHDPNTYIRPAISTERKWFIQARAGHPACLLYLAGSITLTEAVGWDDFRGRCRWVWERERWEWPGVCLKPFFGERGEGGGGGGDDDDGEMWMECRIPRDGGEARRWVDETMTFELLDPVAGGGESSGGRDGYYQLGSTNAAEMGLKEWSKGHGEWPVTARLTGVASFAGEDNERGQDLVRRVQYCFCADHVCADGLATHMIAGRFFEILAEAFAGDGNGEDGLDWAACAERLPIAWVGLINEHQRTMGKEFDEGVNYMKERLDRFNESDWGLKGDPAGAQNEYRPRNSRYVFSKETMSALSRSLKSLPGGPYTITQLGHAATLLTMLRVISSTGKLPNSKDLACALFVDGRRYLNPERLAKRPITQCRAMSVIEFRDYQRYALRGEDESEEEVRKKVLDACGEAKMSYEAFHRRASLLTESFAALTDIASSKSQVGGMESGVAQPFFITDGVIERLIRREYFDAAKGRKVLTVDEVNFVPVPEGLVMIVRISTFRDRLRLAAEWDRAYYSDEMIEGFVQSTVELMGSVLKGDTH